MSTKLAALATLFLLVTSCDQIEKTSVKNEKRPVTEFSDYYSDPVAEKLFSSHVADTFRIFTSIPKGYSKDSAKTYPLIIILDANAFFEPLVSELKFNSFIGMVPRSIVVGIGYANFPTMDSLRSRDYTWPTAIPEYQMSLSGGADKFKRFIDEELVPKLNREHKIDMDRSVICGHSLGGYFTLFYGLKSMEENKFTIRSIVSASPSLHYNNRYLFEMENNLARQANEVPLKIYISMGSEDMADPTVKGILDAFQKQVSDRNYKGLKIKKAEYTNFGHIDAAIPGFIKGLSYVFEK